MVSDNIRDVEFLKDGGIIKSGKIIEGRVVGFQRDKVLIDIGLKEEGYFHLRELDEIGLSLKEGDIIEVKYKFKNLDLHLVSFKEAITEKYSEFLLEKKEKREPVLGKVIRKGEKFYEVVISEKVTYVGAYIALVPLSHAKDIEEGKEYEFLVLDRLKSGTFLLSRKEFLNHRREEERKKVLSSLSPGKIVSGFVKRVYPHYIDVDLGGGVIAKVLKEDIDWKRVIDIKFKNGDKIDLVILDIRGEFVRGGIKQMKKNPYEEFANVLKERDTFWAEVVDVKRFGVFVKIDEYDVEGLLPNSEISWGRLTEPLKIGDKVFVKVVRFEPKEQKIMVSAKQKENPLLKIKKGDKVSGKIVGSNKGGYIVDVKIENEIFRGFLPKSEADYFMENGEMIGEEREFLVLDIFKDELKLSLKRTMKNPFRIGDRVKGEITFFQDDGIIITFSVDGKKARGFIPKKELADKISNYKKGAEIEAEIIGFDENLFPILSEAKSVMKGLGKMKVKLGEIMKSEKQKARENKIENENKIEK